MMNFVQYVTNIATDVRWLRQKECNSSLFFSFQVRYGAEDLVHDDPVADFF